MRRKIITFVCTKARQTNIPDSIPKLSSNTNIQTQDDIVHSARCCEKTKTKTKLSLCVCVNECHYLVTLKYKGTTFEIVRYFPILEAKLRVDLNHTTKTELNNVDCVLLRACVDRK